MIVTAAMTDTAAHVSVWDTSERDLEHLFSKYGRYFLFLCFQLYVCKHSSRLNVVSFLWFCFGYASLGQLLIRFVAVFLDQSLNKG